MPLCQLPAYQLLAYMPFLISSTYRTYLHSFKANNNNNCVTAVFPDGLNHLVPEETFTHSHPVFVAIIQYL